MHNKNHLVRMRTEAFTNMGEGELWAVAEGQGVCFAPTLNRFIDDQPPWAVSENWAKDFKDWINASPDNRKIKPIGLSRWDYVEEGV